MKATLDNWKTEGSEKWGPLSNLPRADAIIKACTILDASDDGISREGVRELIGGGSDRDIWPVIKLFQDRQSINSKYEFTPDTLLQLLARQVDEILENLQSDVDSKIVDEKNAFNTALQEISTELTELEAANDRISTENANKNLKIESLIEQASDLKDINVDVERKYQELENKYKDKLSEIEHYKEKLQDRDDALRAQETKHKEEVTRLSSEGKAQRQELILEQDKERDRLMLVQGNERSTWQSTERKLNKEITQHLTMLQQSRNELETKAVSYMELHKESTQKDNTIIELSKKVEDLSGLKDKVEKLTAVNSRLEEDNTKLSIELENKSSVSDQFKVLQDQISKMDTKMKKTK